MIVMTVGSAMARSAKTLTNVTKQMLLVFSMIATTTPHVATPMEPTTAHVTLVMKEMATIAHSQLEQPDARMLTNVSTKPTIATPMPTAQILLAHGNVIAMTVTMVMVLIAKTLMNVMSMAPLVLSEVSPMIFGVSMTVLPMQLVLIL